MIISVIFRVQNIFLKILKRWFWLSILLYSSLKKYFLEMALNVNSHFISKPLKTFKRWHWSLILNLFYLIFEEISFVLVRWRWFNFYSIFVILLICNISSIILFSLFNSFKNFNITLNDFNKNNYLTCMKIFIKIDTDIKWFVYTYCE